MGARILVIDDDPVIGAVVTAVLGREDYEVVLAADGPDGLEEARRSLPDLIVVDSVMPGMTGADVVRALRADPFTAGVPLVMMSASPKTLAAEAGDADGTLAKPFDPGDLLATVSRLLR
jgi:CheY-like chemotaxis protein